MHFAKLMQRSKILYEKLIFSELVKNVFRLLCHPSVIYLEDSFLLEYNALLLGNRFPSLRRITAPTLHALQPESSMDFSSPH